MTNYYKVLGVSDRASTDEIKTAYRKLSKKFHPDVNEGDKFFEERFKEIQSAYEALNDSVKKSRLDEFLRHAEAESRFHSNQNQANAENTSSNNRSRNKSNFEKDNSEFKQSEQKKENNNYGATTTETKTSMVYHYFIFFAIVSVIVVGVLIASNKTKKSNSSNSSRYSQTESYLAPRQSYDNYGLSNIESNSNANSESNYNNSNTLTNFSIGSTKNEVLSIQGNPTSTNNYEALNQEIWYFGISSVTFTGGKVSEYSDYGNNLRVRYSDNSNDSEANFSNTNFSIGSTKKEVLSIQGNPTSTNKYEALNQEIWYFGISSVTFTRGKVSEYSDYGNNLRVRYSDNSNDSEVNFSKTNFSIGSTKKEVLSVQGNPTSTNKYEALNQEIWYFGISSVTFTGGKVTEYSDYGNNLRVKY